MLKINSNAMQYESSLTHHTCRYETKVVICILNKSTPNNRIEPIHRNFVQMNYETTS